MYVDGGGRNTILYVCMACRGPGCWIPCRVLFFDGDMIFFMSEMAFWQGRGDFVGGDVLLFYSLFLAGYVRACYVRDSITLRGGCFDDCEIGGCLAALDRCIYDTIFLTFLLYNTFVWFHLPKTAVQMQMED